MNKRFLLLALFLMGFVAANAQRSEFGVNLFAAQYFGDLREKLADRADFGDFLGYSAGMIKPGFGAYIKHNVNERVSLRGSLNLAFIGADDKDAVQAFNLERNLHFKSTLIEFSGIVEYNLVPFEYSKSSLGGKRTAPYVFGGLALIGFNPEAEFTNADGSKEWVELHPLGTEGQEIIGTDAPDKYSRAQFAVPIGAGIKWALGQNWRLAFEVGHRFTFTDYLDDVSGFYVSNDIVRAANGEKAAALADRRQELDPSIALAPAGARRGDPESKDSYLFFGFSLGYVLYKNNCPTWF